MVLAYERQTTNRSIGQNITAAKLQEMNNDLDELFKRLDSRDISTTYNIQNQLTQVVDNQNSITINLDWSDFADPTTPKIYIQEVGDTNRFTCSYSAPNGPLVSVTYGP